MKKAYETPAAEKLDFGYAVAVAASGGECESVWVHTGVDSCTDGNAHWEYLN